MMKVLKWIFILVIGVVVLTLLASWILAKKFNSEFEKTCSFTPSQIAIPTDSASIERGRVLSVGCRTCHDVDLAGKVFFDDPNIGSLPSSNLTRAKGSETEGYTSEDFVRALRHGLNKSGHALMVMPSKSIGKLSDQDLGCLVAFLNSLQPIDRTFAKRQFTYMSQAMAGAGMFGNLFDYKVIDHDKVKNVTAPPISNSKEYGAYVAGYEGCMDCHGKNFGGGVSPDPVSPPVPDISKSGKAANWTLQQFTQTFRTGTTPEGKSLNGQFMPFAGLGALSDVEIESVYNYIQSFPPANK